MYSLMTVPELKAELIKRKASVGGKKAVLIERLEAYDRNHNFGASSEDTDESYYCPSAESYRDINASTVLPKLTKQHIQAFIERFQTKPKGRLMYESRYLLTARAAVEGNNTFIRGQCKAQMKKVSYMVNIKLSADGSIEEAHCECAAGSGVEAHCKHVMVLLYGTEDMVRTKTMILHQVCTQQLMNFRQPRRLFYDSPMQAEKLPNKRKLSSNYSPLNAIVDNYEDYVRNLLISQAKTTMPILQCYRPANPYAIENDHHYLKKKTSDVVLEELLLRNVTEEKVMDVERNTRQQAGCKEWHYHRTHRITASYFHAVCHSKPSTRKHLAEKILYPKPFHSRTTQHGKVHEVVALQKYAELYDLDVKPCGLFISVANPFLGATPDGMLNDSVIEVKCPYTVRYCKINCATVPYLECANSKLSLKKKHPYYTQIQGQLYCTNKMYCNLIIYTFVDMVVVVIDRDDTFINEMLTHLTTFYRDYMEKAILDKIKPKPRVYSW